MMLLDLDAYRQRKQSPAVKPEEVERTVLLDDILEQRFCRHEAQRAVGRVPLRDVLLSLKRSGLIVGFRIHEECIIVRVERTLPFMFATCDLS